MGRFADLLVLTAALIWGVGYLAQKTAMEHVGPLTFLAARSAIALVVLLPFALRERGPLPWRGMLAGGGMFFLSASVQQTGMVTASVTNTAFLTALYIVVAPVLALVLLGRRSGATIWLGAALALAGCWALSGGRLSAFVVGDWLVLASSVGWAGYMLVTEATGRAGRPVTFTAGTFAIVAVLAGTGMALTESPTLAGLAGAGPEIAFVGTLSSALTFALMAIAMRHMPAPRAAILLSTEAVFAALFAAFTLGERLPPLGWAGAALILAAVLMVQVRRGGT